MDKTIAELTNDLLKGFNSRNSKQLRDISEKSTSILAVQQTKAYFYMALISYILSKMIQKPRYSRAANFFDFCSSELKNASDLARKGREQDVQSSLEKILKQIGTVEQVDRRFIHDIIEKGRLKIAAMLYAEGLSLSSSAALTGADKNEVLRYSGGTTMSDRFGKTVPVSERLKNARKILK